MLHTLACSLLLAAATWSATPVAAEDVIEIPYEVEADGTVPFVDLSGFEEQPQAARSRALLGLSASGSTTTTNVDGKETEDGSGPAAPTTKEKHTTSSSSVKCKAFASSESWSASQDAHVTAVAFAFKKGCSGKFNNRWLKKVRKQLKNRSGFAVAAAWAEAATHCESNGNAAGCAAAKAVATAWAKATFSANAVAFAKALNKCKHCGKKFKTAKAKAVAYGFASEFEKVILEVEAIAESQTCVAGNAEAGNEVFAECIHEVYATAMAKAVAKAIIYGRCGDHYSNLDAAAYIEAEATIDKWEYITC